MLAPRADGNHRNHRREGRRRGSELAEVSSTVAGDIALNGILGLDPTVRNGFSGITVSFRVKGDAPAEELAGLVERSQARSGRTARSPTSSQAEGVTR